VASLAGSYYLLSTVAFCLISMAIGVRLGLLSHRTGARPELYLGIGLFLSGGLGYGLVIGSAIASARLGAEASVVHVVGLTGLAVHHVGAAFSLAFVVKVFRPSERWAPLLAAALVGVLATSWLGLLASGGMPRPDGSSTWYWIGFAVMGTYPFWITIESLHYWALMRRRRTLGLADPLVTNRFALFATASVLAAAAIWTAALPGLLGLPPADQLRIAPLTLSATATFGFGAISAYWLAFFPPAWYSRRLGARAAA
jgi:hypothetical protein